MPGTAVTRQTRVLALSAVEAERATSITKRAGPPAAVTEALGTLAATSRRSLIQSWIGMSPGANGKTKVTFLWNPTPARPGVRTETAARVSLIAGGANSDLFYRGKALAPGRVEFEVPPGPVDFEIAVEGATAEVLDRETRKMIVPSMGLGLTLSTPEVFRGRTAPEWQKLAADPAAVPVIERDFRRTDRLLLRIGAQSAGGTPVISARMLNRDGAEMSALPVTPAGFGGLSHIDVPLAALPVGEFLIEVIARDGPEQASTLVAFRVTPCKGAPDPRHCAGLRCRGGSAVGVAGIAKGHLHRVTRRRSCRTQTSPSAGSIHASKDRGHGRWAGRPTIHSPSAI